MVITLSERGEGGHEGGLASLSKKLVMMIVDVEMDLFSHRCA